jgi:hypothetical protein
MTEFMPVTEYPDIEYTEFILGSVGHFSLTTELKIVDINNGESIQLSITSLSLSS